MHKRLCLVAFLCVEKSSVKKAEITVLIHRDERGQQICFPEGNHKSSFSSLKNWCRDLLSQNKHIKSQPTASQASKNIINIDKWIQQGFNISLVLAEKVMVSPTSTGEKEG